MAELLLAGVDLEDTSRAVVKLAADLARRLGWQILLLHVQVIPAAGYVELGASSMEDLRARLADGARRRLEDLAAEIGGARTLVREGDPATEILRATRELDPRLVVMGTHGRRGVSRLLLGSVAEKVARRSTSPVLTVRQIAPAVSRRRAA